MPRVVVDVMPKPEILDPAGQAVERALPTLEIAGVSGVRIGKRIELDVADDVEDPVALVTQVADALLANPVIEVFGVHLAEDHG